MRWEGINSPILQTEKRKRFSVYTRNDVCKDTGNNWQGKRHRVVLITILSIGQFQFSDKLRKEFKFSLKVRLNDCMFTC